MRSLRGRLNLFLKIQHRSILVVKEVIKVKRYSTAGSVASRAII